MKEEFGIHRPAEERARRVLSIVEAVGYAIEVRDIERDLPEDLEWSFDTVEVRPETLGQIRLEGYRDESHDDDVEIVLQVKYVAFGPHRLTYELTDQERLRTIMRAFGMPLDEQDFKAEVRARLWADVERRAKEAGQK